MTTQPQAQEPQPVWDTADDLYAYYDAAYRMGAADAHNNEAAYRQAQADMFKERDKLVAKIAELEQENSLLRHAFADATGESLEEEDD